MKKIATIILNRNLPKITDALYNNVKNNNLINNDIFVLESGSDKNKLSKYTKWYADWPMARKKGLRYHQGMNYALYKLWKEKKFEKYDAFFLLSNDTEFKSKNFLDKLSKILFKYDKLGIISPCSKRWGEKILLKKTKTKFFWYIHSCAYLIKKDFLISIINSQNNSFHNFLFDDSNFRGYGLESEIIAKAYCNDWASAITSEVFFDENESHLIKKAKLIKTESYEDNFNLYVLEGQKWMKNKYGFNSKWAMQLYVKNFYDNFFNFYPEYLKFKI